jgi:MFS family permease
VSHERASIVSSFVSSCVPQELMLLPFLTLGVECEWGAASPIHAALTPHSTHKPDDAPITDVEASLLSTAVFVGMLIGALMSGLLADRVGRRPTVLLFTALTGIFGLWSALASSFSVLVMCRALVGIGVGGSPAALSLFTEFLPKQKRGEYLVHYMCYFSGDTLVESRPSMR